MLNGIMASMEWAAIRKAFRAARVARGLKQNQIPGSKQGMVSKLETNHNLGPAVGTFVKAVEGLGIPVSSFFAQIEGLPGGMVPTTIPESLELADHDSLPSLPSEERIAQAAVQRLAERIATLERRLRARAHQPAKNDRPAPAARAEAAERHPVDRKRRPRNERRPPTRRPKKR